MSEKTFEYLKKHTALFEQLNDNDEKDYVNNKYWRDLWESMMSNHLDFITTSILDALKTKNSKILSVWCSLLYINDSLGSEEKRVIKHVLSKTTSFSDRLELAKYGWFESRGRAVHKTAPSYIECQWTFLTHAHDLCWLDYDKQDTKHKLEHMLKNALENVENKAIPYNKKLTSKIFEYLNKNNDKTQLFATALSYPNFQTSIYASKYFSNIANHVDLIRDLCIEHPITSTDLSNIFPIDQNCFVMTALIIEANRINVANEWLEILAYWKESYPQHQYVINYAQALIEAVYYPEKNIKTEYPLAVLVTICSPEHVMSHMLSVARQMPPQDWWNSSDNTTMPLDVDFSTV